MTAAAAGFGGVAPAAGIVASRDDCVALDAADPLAAYRGEFVIADEALIYFDGNSLGRLPRATVARVDDVMRREWGERLIRGWYDGWVDLPTRLGDLIGTRLLGARAGEVLVADSTTVALYKAISAALDARPGRRTIVIEADNFPTDRYVVESLATQRGLDVRWIEPAGPSGLDVSTVAGALDPDVAATVLSHVDYRSAALLDLSAVTAAVHEVGALTVWDLCHSVGVVPIDLAGASVDLAVGCTYKYLNGGPGSPAFTFVNSDRLAELHQPIWGWWSRQRMFDMGPGYEAEPDIRGWLTGTPGVLSLVAVETGVDVVVRAGVERIRAKSEALTALAVTLVDGWLAARGVHLASPRDPARRGSHITLAHPDAERLSRELTERGVIPDFRRPDGIRIGLSPLTTRFTDVYDGLAALRDLLS